MYKRQPLDEKALHPVAIIAVNAEASLAADGKYAKQCVEKFWNTPLRTGDRRYSVSYTHLDVYKRQEEIRTGKSSLLKNVTSGYHYHTICAESEEAVCLLYTSVKDGVLAVEPYEYFDRDAIFICSAETLFKLAEGRLDPSLAFTTGKLKVEGNIDKALRLKQIIDSKKA